MRPYVVALGILFSLATITHANAVHATQVTPRSAATCALLTGNCPSHDLHLEPIQAVLRHGSASNSGTTADMTAANYATRYYGADTVNQDHRDTFRTELRGRHFYLTTNTFRHTVALSSTPNHKLTSCAFYLSDEKGHVVASRAIDLGASGRPSKPATSTDCESILGVSGTSFRGDPAILAIARYVYPRTTLHRFPSGTMTTAVLLPITRSPDGSWKFSQDLSCVPAGNHIGNLARAKAQLALCQSPDLLAGSGGELARDWCQPTYTNEFEEFNLGADGSFDSWEGMRPAGSGTWSLHGRHLTIIDEGVETDFYVKSLSDRKLVVMRDGVLQTYISGKDAQCALSEPVGYEPTN